MIEIEKNFNLRPGDRERLIKGASLISRKSFTDVYYDTMDFRLTMRDLWLRQRDERWELKTPLKGTTENPATNQYRELEDEREIARALELSEDIPLEKALERMGCAAFAKITTNRESYQKGEFHLDFDEMDFGFTTFEAELIIEDEKDIPAAEQKILDFAREYGIEGTSGAGKVIEFLHRNNRAHYDALINAGVVWEYSRPEE